MNESLLLKRKRIGFISAIILLAFMVMPVNGQQLLDPLSQVKFVNPLPIPAEIDATKGVALEMEMSETTQWLGLMDPVTNTPLMTKVWGYGMLGRTVTYPGPTFIAKQNVPVTVTWYNNLPLTGHFLPVDPTLHLAHPQGMDPAAFYAAGNIPTVVHLHGGHTESASDGLPEAWFTQGFGITGPFFVKQTYRYDNDQEAATLWYHDHALGITRLNVYAGLAGFYQLEDKRERNLVKNNVLPKGAQDIEIVIQDRMFYANGQLFLPSQSNEPWFGDGFGDPAGEEPLILPFAPSVVAEFFGNFILVNGVTWPYLDVEPRPYRFRLLNGSDSRFYVLEFGEGIAKMDFLQIGTDDGLLPKAVKLGRLILAPGERVEVVVNFQGRDNQMITLFNYGPDEPFKGNNFAQTPNNTTGQIMRFHVTKKLKENKGNPIPTVADGTSLRPPLENLGTASAIRKLALFEGEDADGRLQPLLGIINGEEEKTDLKLNGSLAWFEPITENPALGAVEEWWVHNATEDAHPIHLHLVSFQIMNRQPFLAVKEEQDQIQHDERFGLGGYIKESSIVYFGVPEPPAANEKGWKDTFIVPPGTVGRIKARFDRPGRYVWHCHILSHEDHEMMRPFFVGPNGDKSDSYAGSDLQNTSLDDLPYFKLYPNPIVDHVNVEFKLEQTADVMINIYDLEGRVVLSEDLGTRQKGFYTYRMPTDPVGDGMYILELRSGEKQYQERIIISK